VPLRGAILALLHSEAIYYKMPRFTQWRRG